jgi:formylglycine-generating enzyme required for sulfatase activity
MNATASSTTQLQALAGYLVEAQSEGYARYREFETIELNGETLAALREVWEWTPAPIIENDGMVWVPPGPFIYGKGDTTGIQHLEHGFWFSKYPVTGAQFLDFLHDTAPFDTQTHREFRLSAQPTHPATGVNWYDAGRYAGWKNGTLPTEFEWEKAARGIDGRRYPWGDKFDRSRCNTDSDGTTPVDQYGAAGASPYGCVDMAGNVWDWTASAYAPGSPFKVLRGGSWSYLTESARCASRSMDFAPRLGSPNVGFRCVRR